MQTNADSTGEERSSISLRVPPGHTIRRIDRRRMHAASNPPPIFQLLDKLAQLRHPHAEIVLEGRIDGPAACSLVCERLEGESLAEVLTRDRTLPFAEARLVTRQVSEALTAAHALGIAHGDLTPEHVVFTQPHGGTEPLSIKVRGFGMCALLGGGLSGTPSFLAPEQVELEQPRPEPTPRSDQFALGLLLCEMVTGRRAFPGESLDEVRNTLLKHDPPYLEWPGATPSQLRRVNNAVSRALAKDPEGRYPTLREFVEALDSKTAPSGLRPLPVLKNTRRGSGASQMVTVETKVRVAVSIREPTSSPSSCPTLLRVEAMAREPSQPAPADDPGETIPFICSRPDAYIPHAKPATPAPSLSSWRILMGLLFGMAFATLIAALLWPRPPRCELDSDSKPTGSSGRRSYLRERHIPKGKPRNEPREPKVTVHKTPEATPESDGHGQIHSTKSAPLIACTAPSSAPPSEMKPLLDCVRKVAAERADFVLRFDKAGPDTAALPRWLLKPAVVTCLYGARPSTPILSALAARGIRLSCR